MTPNNIVNMACLKGLDAIAVTDHNSAENVEAVMKVGSKKGIIVVPGIEVQSREEVHLLCYFARLKPLLELQQKVYDHLAGKNRPDYFGEQVVMDEEDRITGHSDRLLIGSVSLSVEQIVNMVIKMGGKIVPAHVDRTSYSIISNLGFIPQDLDIKSIEISRPGEADNFLRQHRGLKRYRIIHSSDAHRLEDILEREFFMDVREKNPSGILAQL